MQQLITLDFASANCNSLDEKIAISIMMALKNVGSVVSWRYDQERVSVCVTSGPDFVRLSIGSTEKKP